VSAGPSGEIALLLRYHPPYDWPTVLDFLRRRAIAGIELVTHDRYSRTIALDGAQGTVAVEHIPEKHALRASVRFPKLSSLPAIIARLRRIFDLGADPVAIAAHLAHDPVLSPLVKARPGLRVPGNWDGFELAIRAVLGQQITVVAARGLAGKLVARYGKKLRAPEGAFTHVFPEARALAKADLATLGMPRSRAATLSAVAKAALSHPQLFEATGDLETAIERLRAIRGVGEWTAQYIALRQLREPDAFPASDIGLLRAIAKHEARGYSAAELLSRADPWRPWRAYAAQHLWSAA
jgi:AraC family transcriptional regulator of adaptative response / DNA-3-methyladenine glycosylase II